MKYRLFDIAISLLLLPPFLLMILWLAFFVWVFDRQPPLYYSERLGKNEGGFLMLKIRTMTTDAPLLPTGPEMSNYVTPIGAWLRKFSLDELPQIFNILRGQMSWVGPRPCLRSEAELVSLRRASGIFNVPPGLTGLAQINGRDILSVDEKVSLDSRYVSERSVALNFRIVCATLFPVFVRKNISY